jgi:hypothetical protein
LDWSSKAAAKISKAFSIFSVSPNHFGPIALAAQPLPFFYFIFLLALVTEPAHQSRPAHQCFWPPRPSAPSSPTFGHAATATPGWSTRCLVFLCHCLLVSHTDSLTPSSPLPQCRSRFKNGRSPLIAGRLVSSANGSPPAFPDPIKGVVVMPSLHHTRSYP